MAFDLTDLMRGEGEWRNMQEVVRRSFRFTFEKIEQQQEQISQLVGTIASLKSQIAAKPTSQEVDDMVSSKLRKSSRPASRDEIDEIRQQLADIRADMQRKASTRYVDDALRRKLDKSDALVKNMQSINGLGEYSELIRLSSDIGEVKVKYEILSKTVADVCEEVRTSAKSGDVYVLRELVEESYKMISDRVTSSQLAETLASKVP